MCCQHKEDYQVGRVVSARLVVFWVLSAIQFSVCAKKKGRSSSVLYPSYCRNVLLKVHKDCFILVCFCFVFAGSISYHGIKILWRLPLSSNRAWVMHFIT